MAVFFSDSGICKWPIAILVPIMDSQICTSMQSLPLSHVAVIVAVQYALIFLMYLGFFIIAVVLYLCYEYYHFGYSNNVSNIPQNVKECLKNALMLTISQCNYEDKAENYVPDKMSGTSYLHARF